MSATTRTGAPAEPVIELRAVRYSAQASQETVHFAAVVLVDGRPFCSVRNEGRGGGDVFEPLKGGVEPRMLNAAVLAVVRRINPEAVDFHVPLVTDRPSLAEFAHQLDGEWWRNGPRYAWDIFEALVDLELDRWLVTRDLERAFRSKVLFATPDGKVWERPQKGRPVDELAAAIRAKHPDAVILNQAPIAEAVRIMRAAVFAL